MVKFNGFEVSEDCEVALRELKKLAVCNYRNNDCEENFADVWFHVQHEMDLYEDGEDANVLNSRSYKSAKKWLEQYRHLYNKYEYR